MSNYINTTQIPNTLMDDLLKTISHSELKILLTILRKTVGMIHPTEKGKRLDKVWISQRLFRICTSLSGRAVSSAIDRLVVKKWIEVTDQNGNLLDHKQKRQGASRLYFASRLRLDTNPKQTCEPGCKNPMKIGHTIKLNNETKSCYNTSQGIKRISDTERYYQIMNQKNTPNHKNNV